MNGWVIYDPEDEVRPFRGLNGWFNQRVLIPKSPALFSTEMSAEMMRKSWMAECEFKERCVIMRFDDLPESVRMNVIIAGVVEKIR